MSTDQQSGPGREPEKPTPAGRRNAREIYRELDGLTDEHFRQSVAGFAQRVGERVQRQTTSDPQAAALARRAALEEYDTARGRRLKAALVAGGGAALAAAIASVVILIAAPETRLPAASVPAPTDRTTVVEVTLGKPVPPPASLPPALVPEPLPPTVMTSPLQPPVAVPQVAAPQVDGAVGAAAPATDTPVPSESAQPPEPLRRNEIREVQTLLHAFGFNAGPLDGAAGPVTEAAARRYQQQRGLPQTSTIDRDLLVHLRNDPAPKVLAPSQVAQRMQPQRQYRNASVAPASDPFDGLRATMGRVERWFQNLGR